MTTAPPLPDSCAIAFKEWAGVCEALGRGDQSLILRKGGIAEGPGGFVPEHTVFWLYPTHLHEAQQGLKTEAMCGQSGAGAADRIPLHVLAVVESIARVERVDVLDALEPFHVWTPETVLKRFHYRQPGLWVLGVRIYAAAEPTRLAVTPEHAGCKTWVPLESALPTRGLSAVLDETEAADRRDRLATVLNATR